jgi:hypothetical protein
MKTTKTKSKAQSTTSQTSKKPEVVQTSPTVTTTQEKLEKNVNEQEMEVIGSRIK